MVPVHLLAVSDHIVVSIDAHYHKDCFQLMYCKGGRGDILIVVDLTIPSKLSKEERSLVEKLAEQPSFQQAESVKNQNIFERMKNFFQ